MQPHQERVVAEKAELDEKIRKLTDFMENNPIYNSLSAKDATLLARQKVYMLGYSEVLGERIATFS